ncbi:Eukaryotic translation initiation factor 1A domain-containingprotein [Zostera marina]|uniref:Eukaryotic translation initiation factor 1A domain-containingprotein n=1 Tax=Zostera marina TaxID=29655 RepID=A0A0K9NVE5_ZOSMR|nr:Eukaryotic translation initiation factor 1A domain-containingprotein [Zostera marina]
MGGGRKNMKRESSSVDVPFLKDGESIVKVISLKGSNLIEVMDAKARTTLAMFPSRFKKSIWIKQGSFVVVIGGDQIENPLESGNKVTYMVSQVLFHQHVRVYQKSPDWPEVFKTAMISSGSNCDRPQVISKSDDGSDSDDDGLPPLEANTNRNRPDKWNSDSDVESE